MSGYYHYHRRHSHYRDELVFPVFVAAVLFIAVLGVGVYSTLPDDPGRLPMQAEKPSRVVKFFHGVAHAWKDAFEDKPQP